MENHKLNNNRIKITDLKFNSEKITFILNNKKKYTINNGDTINIPEIGIINLKAIIESNDMCLSLIISPRIISKETKYIIIKGCGREPNEIKKDFLDSLDSLNEYKGFREWIIKNASLQNNNVNNKNNKNNKIKFNDFIDPFKLIYTRENFQKNPKIIKDYIEYGYPPNVPDKWNNLPIHLAISFGSNLELITFLLKKYKNVIFNQNEQGNLPIHLAAHLYSTYEKTNNYLENGYILKIIELLLSDDFYKQTLNLTNNNNKLPYQLYKGKNKEIIKILRKGVWFHSKIGRNMEFL